MSSAMRTFVGASIGASSIAWVAETGAVSAAAVTCEASTGAMIANPRTRPK